MPSFLAICNVFRWFVQSFTHLAARLNKKLRKDQPKTFGALDEKESTTAASSKEVLAGPLVVDLMRSKGQYTLDTDACCKKIAYVLLQKQKDKSNHPVGHWSRPLND